MKQETYILFTAGRGPLECGLAVHGIQNKFKKYLASHSVSYSIVSQKKGAVKQSVETILFKVMSTEKMLFEAWIGTHQWICKSPIRKFHKRKNWYIKCEEVTLPQQVDISTDDVIIKPYKASGPGGQHRNKVETAIRIIHKSSGIIVTASDGKSQAQNKKKAWEKLKEKLRLENENIQNRFDEDQWISQIEIERGNPIKTFKGPQFR